MGLDMYFSKRKQFYKRVDKNGNEVILDWSKPNAAEVYDTSVRKIITEDMEVGYFRKFNALHNYIVQVFAEGRDECQDIFMPDEGIQELLDTLKQIQADHTKASKLLPTAEGFFFGGTDYDEYYFDCVDVAIEMITQALENPTEYGGLVYQASW